MLDGGRGKKEDQIDHGVGLEFHKRIGDHVETGEKLVTIQYNSDTTTCRGAEIDRGQFRIRGTRAARAAAGSPHHRWLRRTGASGAA